MPSDLTAAEVVAAAAPVAGALGIEVEIDPDFGDEVLVVVDGEHICYSPANAARLLVGMVEERKWGGVVCELELDDDSSDDLRTLFLLTMRAFARAKGVES